MSSYCFLCFFFFKQKTAYEMRISDWSSDVCSSDLDQSSHMVQHRNSSPRNCGGERVRSRNSESLRQGAPASAARQPRELTPLLAFWRFRRIHAIMEERRVGNECISTYRYGVCPYTIK